MDAKPRLLDLFSGAGGCAVGYHRAGFDVTGVDILKQPHYPFAFVQADALEYLAAHGAKFDVIHASPPCQHYTTMNNRHGSESPPLIAETLAALDQAGRPWVVENVEGAASALRGRHSVTLTGEMFGLRVFRPRLFASSLLIMAPDKPARQRDPVAVYGRLDGRRLWSRKDGTEHRAPRHLEEAARAMGIGWMDWDTLREAIPPAYTEYVGRQLISYLEQRQIASPDESC